MTAPAIRFRNMLFQPDLGQLIAEDLKTQTRRLAKPQPEGWAIPGDERGMPERVVWKGTHYGPGGPDIRDASPYGIPGDRIRVRERFLHWGRWYEDGQTARGNPRWRFQALPPPKGVEPVVFKLPRGQHLAPRGTVGWNSRPGLYMPIAHTRSTLLITEVRMELLQSISEKDAIREGITEKLVPAARPWPPVPWYGAPGVDGGKPIHSSAREAFRALWIRINGEESWRFNPWVWVISFERVRT